MAVNKKDRKQIISSWPQRSVAELARDLNLKPAEVQEVLDEAGVQSVPETAPILGRTAVRPLSILVLVAAVALVYLNSVRNGFHYDDIHSLLQNLGVQVEWERNPESRSLFLRYFKDPTLFSSRPQVAMPRPILMCTFGLNYMISRYDAWSWVLANMLIHLANVLIVYIALCRLTGRQRFALFAALVWALHPINTETVNYINCRSESLSIFFMLLTMFFFTGSLLEKKRWGLRVTAMLVFALGLLTKEMVITTAGMVLVLDLLFVWPQEKTNEPVGSRVFDRVIGWYLPIFVVVLLYMIYRKAVLDTAVVKMEVRPYDDNLLIQMRALTSYLRLLFFPFKLNISYENAVMLLKTSQFWSNPFVRWTLPAIVLLYALLQYGLFLLARGVWKDKRPPLWQPLAYFGVVVFGLVMFRLLADVWIDNATEPWSKDRVERIHSLISFIAMLSITSTLLLFGCYLLQIVLGGQRTRPTWQPLVSFAILLFFITLSITSLIPLNALMNEHRLYLPSLGVSMLIAGAFEAVAGNLRRRSGGGESGWWPWPVQAAAVLLLLAFAGQTVNHNFSWYTDYTVWKDSITNSPRKAQVVSDLGNAYYREARVMVDPSEIQQDGIIDRDESRKIDEIFHLDVPMGPISPETKSQMDKLFLMGLNRAEFLYMWAIRVEPDYFKAWHNLGTINYTYSQVAMQKKNYSLAKQYLERAVYFFNGAINYSRNGESYNDWASSVLQMANPMLTPERDKQMELLRRAEQLYSEAIRWNPEMCKGYTNLGMIKSKLGKPQEALTYLDQAIQCNPLDPQPWYLKGMIYNRHGLGRTQAVEYLNKCLQLDPGYSNCVEEMQFIRAGGAPNAAPP